MEIVSFYSVPNFCRNDELSSDSELFILFAENSQILLRIYVIPILLTFMYLVALSVNNQLYILIIKLN